MTWFGFDCDPTQLCESVDAGLAAEAPIPRGLHAAERHLRFIVHGRPVDVADARLDLARDVEALGGVAREDGSGQAIFGVVGELDSVLFVARAADGHNRPEALVAEQVHLWRD